MVDFNADISRVPPCWAEFLRSGRDWMTGRSGKQPSLFLKYSKEGEILVNFKFGLGKPDLPHTHTQDVRNRKKKKKSANRVLRNNARAAAYQSARAAAATAAAALPVQATPSRSASSPFPPIPPIPPTARPVTSLAPSPPRTATRPAPTTPSRSAAAESDIWQPSELDSTLAGQFETVPLTPHRDPHRDHHQNEERNTRKRIRFSQEELRDEVGGQASFSEPPHDDVSQETDVSPSSSPSPPREEPTVSQVCSRDCSGEWNLLQLQGWSYKCNVCDRDISFHIRGNIPGRKTTRK